MNNQKKEAAAGNHFEPPSETREAELGQRMLIQNSPSHNHSSPGTGTSGHFPQSTIPKSTEENEENGGANEFGSQYDCPQPQASKEPQHKGGVKGLSIEIPPDEYEDEPANRGRQLHSLTHQIQTQTLGSQ